MPLVGVRAVDETGRFAIVRTTQNSPYGFTVDARVDRLTGAAEELNEVVAADATLDHVIVYASEPTRVEYAARAQEWIHVPTGRRIPIPPVGPPAHVVNLIDLTGDGQYAAGSIEPASTLTDRRFRAVVVGADGSADMAPIEDVVPVDMSSNGRWVLLVSQTIGDPTTEYFRWDRVAGVAQPYYRVTGTNTRAPRSIGDQGQVIETERAGGSSTSPLDRVVARSVSGQVIELIPPTLFPGYVVSEDGSLVATGGGPVTYIETATGGRTTANDVVGPFGVVLGHHGGTALTTSPGNPAQATTTADLVAYGVPGRRPLPRVRAGEPVVVRVAGVRGVPAGVSAVVLNVTVTNSSGPGFLTVWPCDEPRPDASNVNVTGAGQTVANAVVSKVAVSGPAAGSVCLFASTGVDVIVDVQGFFTGAGYAGIVPDRFVDTRNGETDEVGNVVAGGVVRMSAAGVRGVPAGVSAVVLNVTVTNSAGPGFVTVWPCDEDRPDASNVNFSGAGVTVANAVVSKVAVSGVSAGSVCLFSSAGADVIVDVQGFFTGAAYSGVTPDRFLDTRNGENDAVGNVAGQAVVPVPVAGVRGVASDASAVVLNVTVTNPAGPGFATVWPCDEPQPEASNVNFSGSGVTVANAVVSKVAVSGVSAGAVCLFASTRADLIVDVQGSFTGSAYVGMTPDRFLDTRD